jgi:hypothetical protein
MKKIDVIVLIDDQRNLEGADIIIRTVTAATKFLSEFTPSTLWIDHDLGSMVVTGNTLLLDMFKNSQFPDGICIVSSNPVGKKAMEACCRDYGYQKEEGLFTRKHQK